MRTIHLMNEDKRDATVAIESVRKEPGPKLGQPGAELVFNRYLIATSEGLHAALANTYGGDYSQALVDGDPEVDMEVVGRSIGPTSTVYLSADGTVMHAAPQMFDVIFGPDGQERERRPAEDVMSNTGDEVPVRWTGKKNPTEEVMRRFAFRRTVQIRHVDGLTYDFCFRMAKQLHEENAMVLIGAGAKGRDPLIFQENGSPYRGFLSGRIQEDRYKLLLHLSNLELKTPNQ